MRDVGLLRRAARLRVVIAAIAVLAMASTGSTYAAFSDFATVEGNRSGAARVAVGLPGGHGSGAHVSYPGLLPGVATTRDLDISYLGTVAGDLGLELRPDGGSAFCDRADDGTWHAKPGGSLQISTGGGWVDYCSLLDADGPLALLDNAGPGSTHEVAISLRLAPGTDHRYSELTDVDGLTVTARQASLTAGGFTDFAVGSITVGSGLVHPVVPAECGPVGGYKEVVVGTAGDDVIDAGDHKEIVLGLGGDDVIDGGNGKDCLVGGDGDDVLEGANGDDVMLGGAGHDTCNGGHAPDTYYCEAPDEATTPVAPLAAPAPTDEPTTPEPKEPVAPAESHPAEPGPGEPSDVETPGAAGADAGANDPEPTEPAAS